MASYNVRQIEGYPTLSIGQCCSLKVESDLLRVWLCRVQGGVTIERLVSGRWTIVAGGCGSWEAEG